MITRINDIIPRQMRKNFVTSQKSVLRMLYRDLTGDASLANDQISKDQIWNELDGYINESYCSFNTKYQGPPLPDNYAVSEEWIKLNFAPFNAHATKAMHYTGCFNVKYKVQSRLLRKSTDHDKNKVPIGEGVPVSADVPLFLAGDFDTLIAVRTAPHHGLCNPTERIMSVINYGLQGVAIERDKMIDELEDEFETLKTLEDIQHLIWKNETFETEDLASDLGTNEMFENYKRVSTSLAVVGFDAAARVNKTKGKMTGRFHPGKYMVGTNRDALTVMDGTDTYEKRIKKGIPYADVLPYLYEHMPQYIEMRLRQANPANLVAFFLQICVEFG
ncbi:hypothetical protein C1646_767594 [Rhizophagus diaphanus]|nr:hypothetical protein C1646_767594 [Rhizophagus diaphanus] [Rhizophagus sp. MUCL 43196]